MTCNFSGEVEIGRATQRRFHYRVQQELAMDRASQHDMGVV